MQISTNNYRPAAVAGLFYPSGKEALIQEIEQLLSMAATSAKAISGELQALIVPHAGYIYSGLTAAHAYQLLAKQKHQIKRIVLLGPSHHVPLHGLALPNCAFFQTPLGDIALDLEEMEHLLRLDTQGLIQLDAISHAKEHSLEVQLPFLQYLLDDFRLLPIVVGQAEAKPIANIIRPYLIDPHSLVLISTDLSHFLSYQKAQFQDRQTHDNIMAKHYRALAYEDACGRIPLQGLLYAADKEQLTIASLDLRNSGDTAGDKDRVVGYGAWGIFS